MLTQTTWPRQVRSKRIQCNSSNRPSSNICTPLVWNCGPMACSAGEQDPREYDNHLHCGTSPLDALRHICTHRMPIVALISVNLAVLRVCIQSGVYLLQSASAGTSYVYHSLRHSKSPYHRLILAKGSFRLFRLEGSEAVRLCSIPLKPLTLGLNCQLGKYRIELDNDPEAIREKVLEISDEIRREKSIHTVPSLGVTLVPLGLVETCELRGTVCMLAHHSSRAPLNGVS